MTVERVLHALCLLLWLAYMTAWGMGLVAWWLVMAYTVVVTVAWAETGNRETM